jgi:hypothetical protein
MKRIYAFVIAIALVGLTAHAKDKPPAKKPAQEQKKPAKVPEIAGHAFMEFNVPGAGVALEKCGKSMDDALDASGMREPLKKQFPVKVRCTAAWLFMACAGHLVDEEMKRNPDGEIKHMGAFELAMATKNAACTSPSGVIIAMDGDVYEAVKAEWLNQRAN